MCEPLAAGGSPQERMRSYHSEAGWEPGCAASDVVKLVSEGYLSRASYPQPRGYPQVVRD
ncbi:hypothetical protein [Allorhizocola rhizosphaerae]|uniref:hypothetical protein n=1 Tax=Allorhizocola rhizosphaerae TaxID=1872709 RepID=UPI0013C30730|nr:hypothetical protein [Allorhizocola rhizosphaerae]